MMFLVGIVAVSRVIIEVALVTMTQYELGCWPLTIFMALVALRFEMEDFNGREAP